MQENEMNILIKNECQTQLALTIPSFFELTSSLHPLKF